MLWFVPCFTFPQVCAPQENIFFHFSPSIQKSLISDFTRKNFTWFRKSMCVCWCDMYDYTFGNIMPLLENFKWLFLRTNDCFSGNSLVECYRSKWCVLKFKQHPTTRNEAKYEYTSSSTLVKVSLSIMENNNYAISLYLWAFNLRACHDSWKEMSFFLRRICLRNNYEFSICIKSHVALRDSSKFLLSL